MASNYDSVDLDFSWDGDFILDHDGDLKDTSEDLLLSLRNEITTIVKSELGDWRESVNVGAGLDDFIGEPNNRDTAKAIEFRVKNALQILGRSSDFAVRVIPVHIHRVLIAIRADVLATPENKLRSGDSVTLAFLYDYFEKGIFVPVEDMTKFNNRGF